MASVRTYKARSGETTFQVHFRDEERRQRSITVVTAKAAARWKKLFESLPPSVVLGMVDEERAGHASPAEAITVRDVVEDYIVNHPKLSSGTRGRHRDEAARDVYGPLGDIPAAHLTPETIEQWIARLGTADRLLRGKTPAKKLGPKTIKNRHGLLSAALARAVRLDRLPHNPASGVPLPEIEEREMVFLDADEWWLLHDALYPHFRDFALFLVSTGARFGEATALRRRDCDLVTGRVRIAQAWKEDELNNRYLGPPKSRASKRSIPIDGQALDALGAACEGKMPDGLVWLNSQGNPIVHSSFHSHTWARSVAKALKAGLTQTPRPHDLRHTYASLTLGSGKVTIWDLQKLMGHDDPRITSNRYGHLMPETFDRAGSATSAALSRKVAPPHRTR